ncbi:MAG: Na+/H+ antiporter NhaC family protein [Clostridia bacterium]|nr:Na+/H+ antiporter NhaC family protein [Clostridia bacterium]
MKRTTIKKLLIVALCFSLVFAMSVAVFAEDGGSRFENSFWALIPPILAIVLALITKEAYSSLFIGVVVGALMVSNFKPVGALDFVVNDSMIPAIADNAGIFLFLVLLGIIVNLVNLSGGSSAFGRWAQKAIKTRVGTQLATFCLGILIFIDDYFNCLTVGSVMMPITDSHKISRAKLSYLIDATAAPVCMIAPVSSWAAAVSGVAEDLGTGISGIQLFIKAIPYNFYSLLTFVFIIGIVLLNFDYGPMKKHEAIAKESGELGGLETSEPVKGSTKGKVIDLILPVVVLIILCVIGMLYVGGYWGGDNAGNFINAFGDTDAFVALPWGSIIALILIVIYYLCRRVMSFKEAMECVPKGFISMVPAMTILTLAVSLKAATGALGAANFIHDLMENASGSLFKLLPAVIFAVAVVLAFATGTSWGTFGILIPIVMAAFPADSKLLIIGISACLAGAVCGDHCSPISDTTIMASAGAQIQHINHVSTQLPYALTVAGVSFVNYIIAGFIQNAAICLIIGAALIIGTLFVLKTIFAKKVA